MKRMSLHTFFSRAMNGAPKPDVDLVRVTDHDHLVAELGDLGYSDLAAEVSYDEPARDQADVAYDEIARLG